MKLKVIDNFLTKSYHQDILALMNGPNFDWYFNSNISYTQNENSRLNEYGFSHVLWDVDGKRNSNTATLWQPGLYQIMDIVDCNSVLRSRADMTMFSPDEFIHDPHVDFKFPHISVVYYVNDSDGDTIFYNKRHSSEDPIPSDLEIVERVSPKANRLVAFEGDIIHTGCSPMKHKNRIIINSNFANSIVVDE